MTTDLDRLIEAVEAGTLPESVFHGCSSIIGHWAYTTGLGHVQRKLVFLAYNGSIDAAVALHEALLPGWDTRLAFGGKSPAHARVFVPRRYDSDPVKTASADGDTPARALLLATLRAYRSTREGG